MKIKHVLLAAIVSMAFITTSAFAVPVVWTLDKAVFDDGATASGNFTYDADINDYSAWNISVTAGTFSAFNYNPANSFNGVHTATATDFVENLPPSIERYIRLAFEAPLTNAGGTTDLDLDLSYECNNCSTFRRFTSGIVTSNVPEPVGVALLSVGLLAFAAARKRLF